jgi:hypothetical protein
MNYASAITGILLALLLCGSAYADFVSHPKVVEVLSRLQIPLERAKSLGLIKVAGALGLVAGILITPLGIAASVCLCVYFILAVAVHARAGDTIKQMLPVLPFLILAFFGLLTTLAM